MMNDHTVKSFDEEIKELLRRIAEMGGFAETLVDDAVTALVRQDITKANEVINSDRRLDDMQRMVEERAIVLIARRQPMAQDLREAVATIRISGDLERVGDLAKNIAKRVKAIDAQFQSTKLALGVEHIAELVLEQLKAVLDCYVTRDLPTAIAVRDRDDEIDALYTSLFRELLTYMMEDPRNISHCTHLLFCAKNIERIGDHATNIAETIHYLITGEQMSEERPKGDESSEMTVEYKNGDV